MINQILVMYELQYIDTVTAHYRLLGRLLMLVG